MKRNSIGSRLILYGKDLKQLLASTSVKHQYSALSSSRMHTCYDERLYREVPVKIKVM